MLGLFAKYVSVGVVNTAIHWSVFLLAHYGFEQSQSASNVVAFLIAVTFSFVANAGFTFGASTSRLRYLSYVGFMGGLSLATGWAADRLGLRPVLTLAAFSTLSLMCGFLYSRFVVFRPTK